MSAQPAYSLGIDVGSTTAKVVLLDPAGQKVFSAYQRHNTETLATLRQILDEALQALGDLRLGLLITGSAGMGIAETYALPFIQEVVASARVIRRDYPQVRTLIDIGGEDAKIIFYDQERRPDIRMNGSCAGGTGAFIDEMATLLNVPVAGLEALASHSTTLYPLASRCGVFAKTDLQNLLSRQVPKEDIAASVFHAVVLQMLATLARGREVRPAVLFSGGPLTFLPSLRRAFLEVLEFSEDDVVQAEAPELLPARGAALAVEAGATTYTLSGLLETLSNPRLHPQPVANRQPALFESEAALQAWEAAQRNQRIERRPPELCTEGDYFLGVDSGSTTTKIVLIDEQGRVVYHFYANNHGDALQAVQDGLDGLAGAFAGCDFTPTIARSAVTGYGEDLVRAAFGLDQGIVETLAHFRAARAFDEQVSFVLDIGGQDMKAIFVKDGQIQNIEINEACSSGCGSFIESFARNMGYSVADFARLACSAEAPYNLGTRCTVFMNSRVKQALREGASIADISAGLAYSVVKNALHKVLKLTDVSLLGEHIVVQGGTFRNPAVHKALEVSLGRPVIRPDLAELMGAYGAALAARDCHIQTLRVRTRESVQPPNMSMRTLRVSPDQTLRVSTGRTHTNIRCRGCENKCQVTRISFANGNLFYSGNRCERIYSNSGKPARTGASAPAEKYALLFDRPTRPSTTPRAVIGIPRVLNLFENYPFWNALLVAAGFEVRLSAPSSHALYQSGATHIMSENLCFPGKLVSGHILDLLKAGVDRIFYPMVFFEKPEFANADNSFNCPVVSGYPDVIRSAIDPAAKYKIPLDMPAITFRDDGLLDKACTQYLSGLGVPARIIRRALAAARQAQGEYKQQVQALGERIISLARQEGRPVVLLMGRPYHIDPLINHHVPQMLANFGVDVITEDCIPLAADARLEKLAVMTQWEYINRYFHAARWAANEPNVELVQLNSFGCGPDPFILDEVRAILGEHGKRPNVIRIDEIESPGSTRLRLRSMIEAMQPGAAAPVRTPIPRRSTKLFEWADRQRTLIVPDFSPFCSPPITRPFADLGFKIEQLPPTDHTAIDVGLKYTNNEICYPGIICLGDLVNALQSGQYDLSRTAVGFSQTGGQCRATSYPQMIKKALVAAGFAEVPVVTLSTSLRSFNDQPGARFNIVEYTYKAAIGMMYTDALSEMYHATVVRETRPGAAWQIAEKYLNAFTDGTIPLVKNSLLDALERAIGEFNQVEVRPGRFPRAGIVGEIYVKYNAFSNNHAADWLIQQGIEVVMPHFFEFFAGGLVAVQNAVRTNVKRRDVLFWLSFLGQKLIRDFTHKFDSVMQAYRFYHPHEDVRLIAEGAKDILSINHQYGEGWLLAGEIAAYAREGVQNVLCLQPFGCIANHVIAKGVQKRLQEKFPQLNLLYLDADAGVSEVNFFNRMHFFLEQARTSSS